MNSTLRISLISIILLAALFASGCTSQPGSRPESTGVVAGPSISQTQASGDPTAPSSQDDPSINPEITPTLDNRLPPEDWMEWPVVPTLSPAMVDVYQLGIELGNRQNAFSKVGDCQIIPDVFLGIFDEITYSLPEGMEYLEDTLERFQGSFAREGYSLKGGFVFPTVFSPLRADSSVCEPGETPYECELRIHQPTFVLISMEFRYDGRTAETHEQYLRRAVEYALERGIVPILATKADNFEGDHSLNLTTAKIAYEYDLPLWNYWRAVQYLPGHGIDWERDSYGFHVTPEAWLVRSESFLKVLDALVREAQGGTQEYPGEELEVQTTPQNTVSNSPNPAPGENISQPRLDINTVADWGNENLIFDLKGREFGRTIHQGLYLADLAADDISPLDWDADQLLGLSPDYRRVLVSAGKILSIIDLDSKISSEISADYSALSPSGAAWDQQTGQVFFLSDENGSAALYRYDPVTGVREAFPAEEPISVLGAANGVVIWGQGSCNQFGNCNYRSVNWSDSSGLLLATRPVSETILMPCQTDEHYVYAIRSADNSLSFHIETLASGEETVFWSLNTEYTDCAWSPSREQIAVTLIDRGWYSGAIQEYHFQLLNPGSGTLQDISFLGDLTEQVSWSPDGSYLLLSSTTQQDDLYQVGLSLLDVESLAISRLPRLPAFDSENYLAVNNVYWIP